MYALDANTTTINHKIQLNPAAKCDTCHNINSLCINYLFNIINNNNISL